MTASIYALADPATGEVRYIGKTTVDPKARLRSHVFEATDPNRCHTPKAAWIRSMSERPAIHVLLRVSDAEGALAERAFIAAFRQAGSALVNLTDGGDGASGVKVSEESRRKMALAKLGKRQSPELIEKRTAPMRGRPAPLSESRRKAAAEHARRVFKTPESLAKRAAALRGRPLSEEHRASIGAAHKGRAKSPEHREAIRAGHLRRLQRISNPQGDDQ